MYDKLPFYFSFTISIPFFIIGLVKGFTTGSAEWKNFHNLYGYENYRDHLHQDILTIDKFSSQNFIIFVHTISIGLIYWILSYITSYIIIYMYLLFF